MTATLDEKLDAIERKVGQRPRSSAYGMAGMRNPAPYACVDAQDGALLYIEGETEEDAIGKLYDWVVEGRV